MYQRFVSTNVYNTTTCLRVCANGLKSIYVRNRTSHIIIEKLNMPRVTIVMENKEKIIFKTLH